MCYQNNGLKGLRNPFKSVDVHVNEMYGYEAFKTKPDRSSAKVMSSPIGKKE
ncbi:MAG: hypothetical protein PWR29_511 [Methanolobus sp.]|jgi:hypothetical protein|nr:hypothetical protein [Methanolobus sp.]